MRFNKVFFISFILLSFTQIGFGQNKSLRISGSLNSSGIGYGVSGIPARRAPFYWLVSGNLSLSFWKITAPFSFNISQQDQTFRYPQPFNQVGISPTYKYITVHAGYRSLNFSEFTLAGTIFLGGGIEVAPPNSFVKVSAMYGRLAKPRLEGNFNDLELGMASYERWGYGTKVTLGRNGQEVDVILFHGKDDPYSIPDSSARKINISPAENFVTGLNVRRNLGSRISVNAEYALSAYTKDIRDPEVELTTYRYANYLGKMYTPTISSQFNSAFQGQVAYKADVYQLDLKYRRLGPEYKTMGSPFMSNDFEDITGGVSTSFFTNKLNLSSSAGVQRNNLNHNQETKVKRFIGSITANVLISDKLTTTVAYSNFNSTTKKDRFYQQSQLDRIDTLLYLQVTNSMNASIQYSLKKEVSTKQFILNGSYQVASDQTENQSVFYNTNFGYQQSNTKSNLTLSANLNFNSSKIIETNNSVGPTATINKLFYDKKVKTSLSSSYIRFYQAARMLNENATGRFTCSYLTKTKHAFGIDLSILNRKSNDSTYPGFTEYRGGLTYSYSFSKNYDPNKNDPIKK